jgi:hypothetical protein
MAETGLSLERADRPTPLHKETVNPRHAVELPELAFMGAEAETR